MGYIYVRYGRKTKNCVFGNIFAQYPANIAVFG